VSDVQEAEMSYFTAVTNVYKSMYVRFQALATVSMKITAFLLKEIDISGVHTAFIIRAMMEQYAHLKYQYPSTRPHGAITQKAVIFHTRCL
jgi:hypothetical protein